VEPGNMKLCIPPRFLANDDALIPDPDKEELAESRLALPASRPENVCLGDHQTKYYLLDTPVIWWGGSVSLILSVCILGVYMF